MTESVELSPSNNEASAPQSKRRKVFLFAVLGVLLAGAIAALFWVISPKRAPLWGVLPPGADVYVYADLEALQSNPAVKLFLSDAKLPGESGDQKTEDNETQRFIDATGFQYPEGLKQLATARKDGNWIGAVRLAVDRKRLEGYLKSRAVDTAQLGAATVYSYGTVRPLQVIILADDLLVFSVGPGQDGLAQAMLLLTKPLEQNAAVANISQSMKAESAAKLQEVMLQPLWIAARGENLSDQMQSNEGPSLGGFLLGEETLNGIETILVSVETSTLTLHVDGELLTRQGIDPKPLAANLSLLASLMRPQAPEPGKRDLRPLWDAIEIAPQPSSVSIRWRPSVQMLSLLSSKAE